MENKQDIHFYSFYVKCEGSHSEQVYMTLGKPPKLPYEIQKEAEDEFYYAVSEGIESDLSTLLHRKLEENGYQKIEIEGSIYYEDPYYMDEEFAKRVINAQEGDAYFVEDVKERLNAIRITNGKESYPIIRKKPIEKPKSDVPLERPAGIEENVFEAFDSFLNSLKKDT